MNSFMDEKIFLNNSTSVEIYNRFAKEIPIVDYHCHLKAKDIYDNIQFNNISEVWLSNDHYKWRLMRANGIDEKYITGCGSDKDKFEAWAETIERSIGNPLYHWTHMELSRYFDIHYPLTHENYESVWNQCNLIIQQKKMTPRFFISKSKVNYIGTTDDPFSDLKYHEYLRKENNHFVVIPTLRLDKIVKPTFDFLVELTKKYSHNINTLDDYLDFIFERFDFFKKNDCHSVDLGLERLEMKSFNKETDDIYLKLYNGEVLNTNEREELESKIVVKIMEKVYELDWVMQLHVGAEGSVNNRSKIDLGVGKGFDTIKDQNDIADNLLRLLNILNDDKKLPKLIYYNIDGNLNTVIQSILACFQFNEKGIKGKMQQGPAWWFQDNFEGNSKQLLNLSEQGTLMNFIGMTTDSRSFLSYVRHDYFRRILCNILGGWIEEGTMNGDPKFVRNLLEAICYNNAINYFNLTNNIGG